MTVSSAFYVTELLVNMCLILYLELHLNILKFHKSLTNSIKVI